LTGAASCHRKALTGTPQALTGTPVPHRHPTGIEKPNSKYIKI
jgi:hypothetical protein